MIQTIFAISVHGHGRRLFVSEVAVAMVIGDGTCVGRALGQQQRALEAVAVLGR